MTNIKVLYDDIVIGAIQSLTLLKSPHTAESRSQKLTVTRMRLDKMRCAEVFSRGFVHVAAQKMPMQIVVEEDEKETFRAHNVWIEKFVYSYTSGDWVLLEGTELEAESVSGNFQVTSDQSTST